MSLEMRIVLAPSFPVHVGEGPPIRTPVRTFELEHLCLLVGKVAPSWNTLESTRRPSDRPRSEHDDCDTDSDGENDIEEDQPLGPPRLPAPSFRRARRTGILILFHRLT